jgi:hypothetical protein
LQEERELKMKKARAEQEAKRKKEELDGEEERLDWN